jgi:hypothetical protein
VSWIERMLEERLASAAASGELDTPHLKGRPLPGIDETRPQGWWAQQFVARELSHDRRVAAEAAAAAARAGFWRAESTGELDSLIDSANQAIAAANINLIESDRLAAFDASDIRRRWSALREP